MCVPSPPSPPLPPRRPRGFATLCNALFRARDRRFYQHPSVPILLSDEIQYNTNFGGLHEVMYMYMYVYVYTERETVCSSHCVVTLCDV